MKNSNDTIGNWSRDPPVCSAVPHPLRPMCICTQTYSSQDGDAGREQEIKKIGTAVNTACHRLFTPGIYTVSLNCSDITNNQLIKTGSNRPHFWIRRNSTYWGTASLFWRLHDHTTLRRTHLDEWSARSTDLILTTGNNHNREIHAPGGIRTHNLSRRAAADLPYVAQELGSPLEYG
jgi:hypothetical protein